MNKISIGLLTILLIGTLALYAYRRDLPSPVHAQAISVTGVSAIATDVPIYVDGLGTVIPEKTVTVRTQISGVLDSIHFKEGQKVRNGDVLATIDSRYIQATLHQALGQMARDRALLSNAQRDLERYRQAVKAGTITQQTYDTQSSLVDQYKGVVSTDAGAIEADKVELSYTAITSPIDGVVGLRRIDVGNYVQPNDDRGIATVVSTSPIGVAFPLPERSLDRLLRAVRADTGPLPASALDQQGRQELASGYLSAIDNAADIGSGTVKIKALFPNDHGELFPNEFVNARVRVGVLKRAVTVLTQAIQHGTNGDYIFTVSKDSFAVLHEVKAGPQAGDQTALIGGDILAGEAVITDGAGRVANHSLVSMHLNEKTRGAATAVPPSVSASPKPSINGIRE